MPHPAAPNNTPPPNILVVDDTPANLQLLVGLLKERGYKVRPVPDGELALRAAQSSPPDLVLLDVTMPGMDGFEVCARLKADDKLRDVPVLFISALNDTADKVRAFQAGGVDYVTKPFQFEEVEARVRTHLDLRRKEKQLEESYARLRELELMRDSLTHMVVHDMRSPLLALQLSCDMLATMMPASDVTGTEIAQTARDSVVSLVEMVNQMLDVSRMEAGKMELKKAPADLAAIALASVVPLRPLAGVRRIEIAAPDSPIAVVDAEIARRVLGNLIGNAIKFTDEQGWIRIVIVQDVGAWTVEVIDDGPGIPESDHQRIFEKFGQSQAGRPRVGTGLGLTFARMAVEAHGGKIGVRSAPAKGSTFWFTLPST